MQLPIDDKDLDTIISALSLGGDTRLYFLLKNVRDNKNLKQEKFDSLLSDKEKFYRVEISYSDTGYVTSDRFKNFTPEDIVSTMKKNKPESVSDVNWVLEPSLSEEKISTYGYRVDWMDGGIGYEYEGIVLGKEGYIDVSYGVNGDGNETKDFFDYYESIIINLIYN